MTEPSEESQAEQEIEVLHPDRTVVVAGREITVREFRALEGMRLSSKISPIVASLREISDATEGAPPDASVFDRLVEEHADGLLDLMAQASEQPREWVAELHDEDFYVLQSAFWGANGGFFMRRLASALTPAMTAAVPEKAEAEASP